MSRGWALAGFLLAGCGNSSPAAKAPPRAPDAPKAYSFTPSPLLKLARSEREVPPVRRQWVRKRFGDDAPKDTVIDDDGITRTVRVHPFRLATPEGLQRAALRQAEPRRPRELHPTRFLIRPSKVRARTQQDRRAVRIFVDSRDRKTATCLVAQQSSRLNVLLRTPEALVLEEAMLAGPVTYRLSARYDKSGVPTVRVSPAVHEATQRCLEEALTQAEGAKPFTAARIDLTAFAQRAFDFNLGAHTILANEAAALGWIELERGEHDAALAYFEDAHWLYHRPEYRLLQAMALQKMGRTNMALTRYQEFVDARPDAPETPMLRARIASMRTNPRGAAPAVMPQPGL
ncbi:MAG: tetratricopeptide repeat protein [Nannocystales bacterium]